jgi:hypothetical protein
MRVSTTFLFCVMAAGFAGCATLPSQSYPAATEARLALYARTKPCCDDPSTLAFKPLPERGFTEAMIDRSSEAFEFHSGLSLLAAFELPKVTTPYRLRVKGLFDDDHGDETSVFYPIVALLDETFIVMRMTSIDSLRLEPGLATVGGRAGLAVTVPVDPALENGRYLIVFTPAALLGAAPDDRREGDMLTPATLAWLERRGDTAVPASPYGRLQITIAPDAPGTVTAGTP